MPMASSAAGTAASAGTSAAAGGSGGALASAAGNGANQGAAGPGVAWASGGTKAMSGSYPDPFAMAMAQDKMCRVYPTQTIGPCYTEKPMMRADISDGHDGLPMRLSFLVVKAGCTPVSNATLDIWHSGSDGIYSAYATGTVCNPGKDDTRSMMYCRGIQTTDENGRSDFSTVFPGWYKGRTIHVHFTVRVNGTEEVTSQLYFEDALTDDILAQGFYKPRGKRDTTNTSDMLFRSGNATAEQVLFSTIKRPDGVLHAWKVISIG
jgi:protocatechuate 3,4-dioxygenase beta subunit